MSSINPLPKKIYKCIYADPPWAFTTYSDKGKDRSAEKHYECMSIQDIYNLPVRDISDDNSVLFLWVTYPLLQEGLQCIKEWGFEYKTCAFSWAKKNPSNLGFHLGMGYWSRSNTEICLLGTKGSPKRKETGTNVPQLIISPRREHSRKPDEVRDRIQKLVQGPYIELFARTSKKDWDVWGNQTQKFEE